MPKYRLLLAIISLTTLLCAANGVVAAENANQAGVQKLTGEITLFSSDENILVIGRRNFTLGMKTVVISRNNRYTSYRKLRRGMTVTITYQPRGPYHFPQVNTIQIVK